MTGIHTREYAPPDLASQWAECLIDDYGNNADITAMLDHTEIHLVLQANPDGRQVAETNPNSPGPTPSCTDSTGLFNVDRFDLGEKDCDWLAINLGRFSHLCSFLVVVSSCPLTCDRCELFTFE